MLLVRELPPLWHDIEVVTPRDRRYRWATDEPRPENVPSGLRHSSTMPGGFEMLDVVLPRNPDRDYDDLGRFATIVVRDAGGEIVSETRLERAPRTSGDRMAVAPQAVGWQAHLDDDKSASMVWVCRMLSRWGASSAQRLIGLLSSGFGTPHPPTLHPNEATGVPSLVTGIRGAWTNATRPISEAVYDAGPRNRIGRFYYAWRRGGYIDHGDANWTWRVGTADGDDFSGVTLGSNLRAAGPGSGTFTPTTPQRYAFLQLFYGAVAGGGDNADYIIIWSDLAVFGDHGLTARGSEPDHGLYASDIVGYAVTRWAPLLSTHYAGAPTITPSSFIIPHLAHYDPTTVGQMIRDATRFELLDWAVWEHKTFWMHPRGARGRRWRARVASSGLEETGPQAERVWNSIIVSYRDVDGSTRTVGPPGSGADTESASLVDVDPENPATLAGIRRRELLQAGTMTAAGATEIGVRFLEQTKLLDRSGRARLVGHVEDDHGVLHPYTHVRAGDTISFIDANDTSPRRIVRAEHDHDQRAVTVDLDAPPDGLQAILERLGVVLVPLGLG